LICDGVCSRDGRGISKVLRSFPLYFNLSAVQGDSKGNAVMAFPFVMGAAIDL
jgi:hypothetical protein